MSISFQPGSGKIDSLQSYIRNSEMSRGTAGSTSRTSSARADYDTVTIQKNSAPDEKDFASVLAKKISSSVQEGVSSEKVDEIREQVETGSYRIDPVRIAEHMLGYA